MNQERFNQLLETYGADIRRWPEALQVEATRALSQNPALLPRLEEEAALDQFLAGYPAISKNLSTIEQGILEKIDLVERTPPDHYIPGTLLTWLSPTDSLFRPTLLACLPLVVGLLVGFSYEPEASISLEEELTWLGMSDDTTYFTENNDE